MPNVIFTVTFKPPRRTPLIASWTRNRHGHLEMTWFSNIFKRKAA